MKITVDLSENELVEICEITGIVKNGHAIHKLLAAPLQAQRRTRIAGKFLSAEMGSVCKS